MNGENEGHLQVNVVRKLQQLLAGASAGLAVDLSLYPLDTIKTRMQSKSGFRQSGGFRNIYKGVPAVALGSAPGSAVFFLTYSSVRELVNKQSPLVDALSATIGEVAACVARVPTEIVKQRAQTSSSRSLTHIVREIFANNGIRGFYKGYLSTVCREIPFSFIEFPIWEWLKRGMQTSTGKECTPFESAACGSLAGLTAAAITTPLDVIKTRIMLNRTKQTRILSTAMSILREEGIVRLYSGVLPRSLWMGLGGFIFFFSYEFTFGHLSSQK